ncbi:Tn3 family transposase, partial [Streptomyces sp. SRF1]|uniref:Tn3 family transposase n=1 Tax=Streptomyces sp. SRF1 TaxID=1549642 RepID=UPI0025B1900B
TRASAISRTRSSLSAGAVEGAGTRSRPERWPRTSAPPTPISDGRDRKRFTCANDTFHPFAPDTLWNTRYLDAAVAQLRAEDHDIKDEDVARLSPLKDRHINFLGRYLFNIKASGPGQGLRPLRDPDTVEDDEGEA